ncbi:MAG: Ig-like domain-containing protein, partial [Bosea sp. (in: a-proteobacteria)]
MSPTVVATRDGRLALRLENGGFVAIVGTEALVRAAMGKLEALLHKFADHSEFIDAISILSGQNVSTNAWRNLQREVAELPADRAPIETFETGPKFYGLVDAGLQPQLPSQSQISSSAQLATPYAPGFVGKGLAPLKALPGEDVLFRSDRYTTYDGDLVGEEYITLGMQADVGNFIDHLPRLPNDDRILDVTPRDPWGDTSRRLSEQKRPASPPTPRPDEFRMNEDGRLTGNIFDNDDLPNGLPNAVTVSRAPQVGMVTLEADGRFEYKPPLHFSGEVTFEASYTDPTTGTTSTQEVKITVVAVADAPTLTVPPAPIITPEDTPVALTGLSTALVDRDGSEALTIRLSNVPTGASFNGVGTDLGNGVWSFTPAQFAAGLTFKPPLHQHGDFVMTVSSTSTEESNGDAATVTGTVTVRVNPVADTPVLPAKSSSGLEDQSLNVGRDIVVNLVDRDGSEKLALEITGFPAGFTTTYTAASGATVSFVGGVFKVSGTDAAVRATLDTLNMKPGTHGDGDFTLTVKATTTDAGVSQASVTSTHPVTFAAIADKPSLSVGAGTFSTAEDSSVALTGVSAGLVDRDSSETAVYVIRQTSGPAVGRFTDAAGNSVGVYDSTAKTWTFTGSDLSGLRFDPPANVTGTYDFSLTATATETNPTGGQVSVLTAVNTGTFSVTVSGSADKPSVTAGTSTGNEDTAIVFGSDVTVALTDLDGSESLVRINIANVPTGSVINWNTALPGSVTQTSAGVYEVTAANQTQLLALFKTLAVKPPSNTDANFALAITATSRDSDNSEATSDPVNHQVVVRAVADEPTLSAATVAGLEDTTISAPITVAPADGDGSETITRVEVTAPAGITLGWNTSLAGTVTNPTGNTFRFTGTQAQIQALLATVTVTPPQHSDVDFDLTVVATSTESNPTTPGGEVAVLTATRTLIVPVTVTAVADTPTVTVTNVVGDEDQAGGIVFGTGITGYSTPDTGNEYISEVRISGFPSVNWVVSYTANAAVTVTGDAASGYVLSIANSANTQALRDVL